MARARGNNLSTARAPLFSSKPQIEHGGTAVHRAQLPSQPARDASFLVDLATHSWVVRTARRWS